MTTNLATLATALYGSVDDLMIDFPQLAPRRPGEACVAVFTAPDARLATDSDCPSHGGLIYTNTRASDGLEALNVANDVDAAIAQVLRFIDSIVAAD